MSASDSNQATSLGTPALFPHSSMFQRLEPFFIFMLFVVIITLAAGLLFQRYKHELAHETAEALDGISRLKTEQISNWMTERKYFMHAIQANSLFVESARRWIQQEGSDTQSRAELFRQLAFLQALHAPDGCTEVALYDNKGHLRLTSLKTSHDSTDTALLLESMRSKEMLFSDIHTEGTDQDSHLELNFAAPLSVVKQGKNQVFGALLFYYDPRTSLFPLIQQWPSASPSAETLLVRRDGNDVVFLNTLRHTHNLPLSLRLPIHQKSLPAAMAALGQEGAVEGMDYREKPVVAYISSIPGTHWKMISKIDQAEVYASINRLLWWLVLLLLCLTSIAGVLTWYWQKKHLQHLLSLEQQHQHEMEKESLSQQLDYLSKYANDIILLVDDSGRILKFNDRALDAYGYTAEEFARLNIVDLRRSEPRERTLRDVQNIIRDIHRAGALRFEAMHTRKDGTHFPVEISSRPIELQGKRVHQSIVRDITKRKAAEQEQTRQRNFIRQVIDADASLIFVKDAQGRFLLANQAMARSYGVTTEGIVGKRASDLTSDPDRLTEYDQDHRYVIENRRTRVTQSTAVLSDGAVHTLQILRKPLIQDDGSVSVLTIATDITELAHAERDLRRLNRALALQGMCNAAVVRIEDEIDLMQEICRLAVETGGHRMAWIGLAHEDGSPGIVTAAAYGESCDYLGKVSIDTSESERGAGPTGSAIRTGVTQVNTDTANNPQMAPWRELALQHGFLSSIALPLICNGRTMGALTIYAGEAHAFNTEEVALLEDVANNLAFGLTALRAIADRKQAESRLEHERSRLRTLVQTIPDLVWLKDPQGIYLGCNQQFERYFGASEQDIIGKSDYEFVDENIAELFREKDRAAMSAGKPSTNEEWVTYPNGVRALLETIKTPVYDANGALIGVMGIARNITERRQMEDRAIRLQHLLDNTRDMIFIFHPETLRFVYVNKEALRSFGLGETRWNEMSPIDIYPLMTEEEFRKFIAPLKLDLERLLRFETLYRTPDGISIPVEVQLQLINEPDEDSLFVAVVRDISERKHADRMLQGQKDLLRQVIDTTPNQILAKDAQGNIILANRNAAAAFGLNPAQLEGHNLSEFAAASKMLKDAQEVDRNVIQHGQEISQVVTFPQPDGNNGWLLTINRRLTLPNGGTGVLNVAVDITQQKLSEIQLAESYNELQLLSLYLENARADERARIALNLHDEMGAMLAAMKMRLAWLASKMPTNDPLLREEIKQISELVSGGIQTMHRIVTQLRPNLLGDVGLLAAISDYVKKYREHTGIDCRLELPQEEFNLNADQSLTVFRILQESLNNVIKHSRATRVDIQLLIRGKTLQLAVKDNGVGFDLKQRKERSFGLIGIRERALMVGGKARIHSTVGKGTQVILNMAFGAGDTRRPDLASYAEAPRLST